MLRNRRLLAIETSGRYLSLAYRKNRRECSDYQNIRTGFHSENLFPALKQLFRGSEKNTVPDFIAVDIGPGSFTGIRVGIAMARALGQAWKRPLIGVVSLDALAWSVIGYAGHVCCIIDALRDEVFESQYRCGGTVQRISPYRLIPITALCRELSGMKEKIFFIGSGAAAHADAIKTACGNNAVIARERQNYPHARCVLHAAMSGSFTPVRYEAIEPLYIRRPTVEERRMRKSA
ncbi:MAG: tRNA (adenosine(37)-N6)-threonylcarbamoyltransferase complex dimerization subunit type 1 TsaB [Elusimicrobia bacterium]|nr:tRNA (adenosine(37)-N6)-threonylcarbamoyltransferase complex dimerization subunit type 1 TsaB [Elusimicrobiota bacterium]MBD3412219.1 tRNA (adenosine(37)-N6)-threonylcarbamoyltransferase complex dimerization subunit type 1 TsaB [Elusimicrobiota bacterium]